MQLAFNNGAALILGGSSDIGLATAGMLIKKGVPVCLTASSEQSMCRIRQTFVVQEQTCPPVIIADLKNADAADTLPEAATDALEKAYGSSLSLSYLLDLAQTDYETLIAAAEPEMISSYIAANIAWRGRMLRAASRAMLRARYGRMVFVSSTAAVLPNAGQGMYSAAKQASEALYRSIGVELAPRGVTTCALRLGYADAGRGAGYLHKNDNGRQEQITARIPLGRAVTITEAVSTLLFLLSDNACAINATTITMDGGLTACK
ncbi:SDR family NAD(P)-dependent oxidoreductase [Oleidesulfovibrio sp.]|uniref:SDR family NAD(P)-dependent oxidoreductase n=1 Tax=Oleidesulfovibrio sp. TaxID=2909707 RepID=UPI003A8927E7